ncbi:chromosomal replication initiator protein DnaA [Patescibacteria group bacterium]|nr:chromosomal replication initiator protein DnaA [Patescibacteria group bacterium]
MSSPYQEIWQMALGEIEINISQANFITWFKNTALTEVIDGTAIIAVPNTFTKEWLEKKYNKLLLGTLRNINNSIKNIELRVSPTSSTPSPAPKYPTIDYQTAKEELSSPQQPNFPELHIDKETNLNPRYTFSSFVKGSSNELAMAASLAVCDQPGMVYNPLFIYGGVGLGKTHLIQSIGNEIRQRFTNKKVLYISADKFSNDLINAIRNNTATDLKENYKNTDILIIDDIQFISGREKSQEEFFHLFNFLYEKNKQIIISSDRPPKILPLIEDRLKSRFSGGMIADISMPDFETRTAILKVKVQEKNLAIPDDIIYFIASNIKNNVRELEGALNLIISSYKVQNKFPDITQAAKILSSIINPTKKITSYKQIINSVSSFYNISGDALLNKNRKKENIKPRQIVMYLMREDLKISYPSIGEKLGGRDHTTVMYACNKIDDELKSNKELEKELELIREIVYKSV